MTAPFPHRSPDSGAQGEPRLYGVPSRDLVALAEAGWERFLAAAEGEQPETDSGQ
ncbi:hypothetical protein ACIQRS_13995 [Streptomyces termitum]|uniref:Uncharacterized protein n=1 Tax=Streptomyces termitum TaxID=67368 RepID=A0A918WDS6_9ACTN|nr:hypothetical protein [Streptomyces termitum]GHB09340.1 hypothetical protein GCM10010305_60400 [Streptomyces termitum]